MENTTEVVNEVFEDVVEETTKKMNLGTLVTGGILAVGTATVIIGTVKVAKFGFGKIKGIVDSKKMVVVSLETDLEDDCED